MNGASDWGTFQRKATSGTTQIVAEFLEMPPETITVVLLNYDYFNIRIVDENGNPVDTIREHTLLTAQGATADPEVWRKTICYWRLYTEETDTLSLPDYATSMYVNIMSGKTGWITVDLGDSASPADTVRFDFSDSKKVVMADPIHATRWNIFGERYVTSREATVFVYTLFDLSGRVLAAGIQSEKSVVSFPEQVRRGRNGMFVLRGQFADSRGKILDRVERKMLLVRPGTR